MAVVLAVIVGFALGFVAAWNIRKGLKRDRSPADDQVAWQDQHFPTARRHDAKAGQMRSPQARLNVNRER
jgi:hypothetical protein